MTAQVDIYNRALQSIGTRTTVTAAEIANNGSNEAIQANIAYVPVRRQLLRMAPWNCGAKTANLTYITSVPGTPENTSAATTLWQPGQPAPPYAYEYQYPVDCLLFQWVTPNTATGFASGIPISTAVTGGAPSFWQGPPVKLRVATDSFFGVTAAAVVAGGTGYAVGDIITLAQAPQGSAPLGAPVQLQVLTAPGGVIATVSVVNVILGEASALGGSYFTNLARATQAQASTTGAGMGATFSLTQTSPATPQRVILTNQEFAIGNYIGDVTDPNLFDDLFQEAFIRVLGATLCMPLNGDKNRAKMAIEEANTMIAQARRQDGNESLTVNDVLPDWLRVRGVNFLEDYSGPYNTSFNYGGLWPGFS